MLLEMKGESSGRPPAEAFVTVQDEKQAKLLSNEGGFDYFKPFLARARTVSQAAEEVGCNLDTMLYRVTTFLEAGLLEVVRLEKRAGRPIKHYRSVHDAYLIPHSVTPYADVEERLRSQMQKGHDVLVQGIAKVLQELEQEGRRVYRRQDTGEVWQESAGDTMLEFDLLDPESLQTRLEVYQGPVADAFSDKLFLTDEEAKAFMFELYAVWLRYQGKGEEKRKPYYFSLGLVPLEP